MHSCNDGIINSHNYHAGQFFVWWCNYYFSEFLYIKFIYLFNVYYNSMVEGAKHAGLHIHVAPNPLRWRHNWRDSVSNHQPHDCLLMRLFRRRSKKTSKLRVTGLCAVNSLETGEFPAQKPVTRRCFHLKTSSWFLVRIWCRQFLVASYDLDMNAFERVFYRTCLLSTKRWTEMYIQCQWNIYQVCIFTIVIY